MAHDRRLCSAADAHGVTLIVTFSASSLRHSTFPRKEKRQQMLHVVTFGLSERLSRTHLAEILLSLLKPCLAVF